MSVGLKRFLVFMCGVPGYLLTFLPWLFSLGIIAIVLIQRFRPEYAVNEIEEIPYSAFSFQSVNSVVFLIFSVVLWIFLAWVTKQLLLLIVGLFDHNQKTWLFVRSGGLIAGWAFVFVLAVFVFQRLSSGFLLSELIVITIGLVSFALEYFAEKTLLGNKA